MRIKYIKIDLANGFKHEINFTKQSVLIKAPNTAGKSLLMSLLTSEPITKQYLFGLVARGLSSEKTIIIEHNNAEYTLFSKVNATKTNCSFKLDEKELCINGLVSTYNKLIETHELEILPMIDQKMNGFFDLSPVKRKEYIQTRFVEGIDELNSFREFNKDKYKTLSSQAELLREDILTEEDIVLSNSIIERNKIILSDILKKETKLIDLNNKISNSINISEPILPTRPLFEFDDKVALDVILIKEGSLTNEFEQTKRNEKQLSDYYIKLNEYNTRKSSLELEQNNVEREMSESDKLYFPTMEPVLFNNLGNFNELINNRQFIKPNSIDDVNIELKYLEDNLVKLVSDTDYNLKNITATLSDKKMFESMINASNSSDDNCLSLDEKCLSEARLNLDTSNVLYSKYFKEKEDLLSKINDVNNKIKFITNVINEDTKIALLKKSITDINEDLINYDSRNKYQLFERWKNNKLSLSSLISPINVDIISVRTVADIDKELIEVKSIRIYLQNITTYEKDMKIWSDGNDIYNSLVTERDTIFTEEFKVLIGSKQELDSEMVNASSKIALNQKAITWFADNDIVIDTTKALNKILDTNGLPKYLSLGKLLKLEASINDIIHLHFTKNMTIKFGYSDRKLDIEIKTSGGNNTYELLSGYETSIIKVCSVLAMSDESKDILRLDEVDATFDTNNRYLFSSFISSLLESGLIKQVFIISHNEEFTGDTLDMQTVKF